MIQPLALYNFCPFSYLSVINQILWITGSASPYVIKKKSGISNSRTLRWVRGDLLNKTMMAASWDKRGKLDVETSTERSLVTECTHLGIT